MAKSKRRPPFGATKKMALEFSRERALKNRIHELEVETRQAATTLQRMTESNVKLADDLRIAREAADAAREETEDEKVRFRTAMTMTFSRGDLNAAENKVRWIAEGLVEAFGRGLASGKKAES